MKKLFVLFTILAFNFTAQASSILDHVQDSTGIACSNENGRILTIAAGKDLSDLPNVLTIFVADADGESGEYFSVTESSENVITGRSQLSPNGKIVLDLTNGLREANFKYGRRKAISVSCRIDIVKN